MSLGNPNKFTFLYRLKIQVTFAIERLPSDSLRENTSELRSLVQCHVTEIVCHLQFLLFKICNIGHGAIDK